MWQLNRFGLNKSAGGGGGSSTRGPSLDLNFISMDESYKTGATLNTDFITPDYASWTAPTDPQGAYKVWVGVKSW